MTNQLYATIFVSMSCGILFRSYILMELIK